MVSTGTINIEFVCKCIPEVLSDFLINDKGSKVMAIC